MRPPWHHLCDRASDPLLPSQFLHPVYIGRVKIIFCSVIKSYNFVYLKGAEFSAVLQNSFGILRPTYTKLNIRTKCRNSTPSPRFCLIFRTFRTFLAKCLWFSMEKISQFKTKKVSLQILYVLYFDFLHLFSHFSNLGKCIILLELFSGKNKNRL